MTTEKFLFDGAILGIDHGLKFIGLALSHNGVLASPLLVIQRKSKAEDFAKINQVIAEYSIKTVVLGLPPRPPDFVGHSQSDTVRIWAGRLAVAIGDIPIYFWDEGLSSVDATGLLRETGRREERVDAHAAAVILQSCIDEVRNDKTIPERLMP